MFEYNGRMYYKVFEVGKIPSYMDPQKRINEEYISLVARNYDPVNIHEAPFWIGHPAHWDEPKALGWIDDVLAIERTLFVSFSHISEEMKRLYDEGFFKKCSVELGDMEIDSEGKLIPYLWALGATNMPAVKGLPTLKFSEQPEHKFQDESKLKNKFVFSLKNDFLKLNQTKNFMNADLKRIAGNLEIQTSDTTTDLDVTNAIINKFTNMKTELTQAEQSLKAAKDANAVKLVDDAIKEGRIASDKKDEFLSFAKNDFANCEKVLASLPKKDLTVESGVTKGTTVHLKDTKKAEKEFSDVTYDDVISHPEKYMGVLSEEQILKLRERSPKFKNSPILD